MAFDASEVRRPVAAPITLTVDEVTVLLGLLGVLCEEHQHDDVSAVANRTASRLRDLLSSATA
jgi:hypothetical protein